MVGNLRARRFSVVVTISFFLLPHPIFCGQIQFKGVSAPGFPRKASGTTIDFLHIAELTIDSNISDDRTPSGPKSDETVMTLCFQLSDLKYAKPEAFVKPDYLGNRKVDIENTYAVKCNNGYSGEFRLEKHYSPWQKNGPNKEIVCSQRVFAWQGKDSARWLTSLFYLDWLTM